MSNLRRRCFSRDSLMAFLQCTHVGTRQAWEQACRDYLVRNGLIDMPPGRARQLIERHAHDHGLVTPNPPLGPLQEYTNAEFDARLRTFLSQALSPLSATVWLTACERFLISQGIQPDGPEQAARLIEEHAGALRAQLPQIGERSVFVDYAMVRARGEPIRNAHPPRVAGVDRQHDSIEAFLMAGHVADTVQSGANRNHTSIPPTADLAENMTAEAFFPAEEQQTGRASPTDEDWTQHYRNQAAFLSEDGRAPEELEEHNVDDTADAVDDRDSEVTVTQDPDAQDSLRRQLRDAVRGVRRTPRRNDRPPEEEFTQEEIVDAILAIDRTLGLDRVMDWSPAASAAQALARTDKSRPLDYKVAIQDTDYGRAAIVGARLSAAALLLTLSIPPVGKDGKERYYVEQVFADLQKVAEAGDWPPPDQMQILYHLVRGCLEGQPLQAYFPEGGVVDTSARQNTSQTYRRIRVEGTDAQPS